MPSRAGSTKRTTKQRGYAGAHQREKRRLNPVVEQQGALCCAARCLMQSRLIPPGTRSWQWDLGHTEDRSAWTGPEHVKCNRSEGASRGNRNRGKRTIRRSWAL